MSGTSLVVQARADLSGRDSRGYGHNPEVAFAERRLALDRRIGREQAIGLHECGERILEVFGECLAQGVVVNLELDGF